MVIAITNRKLCTGDFFSRIEALCRAKPGGILLREKDLAPPDYLVLARTCQEICVRYGVPLILHGQPAAARQLGISRVHLPLPLLEREAGNLSGLRISTSVHSKGQVLRAEALGASLLLAGHIYPTACKPGLPARGLPFLREVCQGVPLPVYAIGGMRPERVLQVRSQGAAGFCVMSELMECPDPEARLSSYIKADFAASLST